MSESFKFNPFKKEAPESEAPAPETPTQYVLSRQDWNGGERPDGYVSTDAIVDKALARGIHISDVIGEEARDRRDELIKKARSKGLDQNECDELARYSQEINRLLNEKMQQ